MAEAEVPATYAWPTNGHLIEEVARLGYLTRGMMTLDPTYGHGVFWRRWKPDVLIASDLKEAKSPWGASVDFRDLPWGDGLFDAVVFDPPYKLNGEPDEEVDERYGVDERTRWQDRMQLIHDGLDECVRVLRKKKPRTLLLKCQDQVVSGRIRWQTRVFADQVEAHGLRLVDRFDLLGSCRPQPSGRRQVHAHCRPSSLLVFQ
jgi:hypothetical protein